jgi:tetratricopeptide (TPR) repeat protein
LHALHIFSWDQDPAELDWWNRQADLGLESLPKAAWYHFLKAMALLRLGRTQEAVAEATSRLNDDASWHSNSLNWLLLALAHQRLGHHEEAVDWLNRAVRSVEDHRRDLPAGVLPARLVRFEPDWRDFQILRAEAEAAILYDPLWPADPFASR